MRIFVSVEDIYKALDEGVSIDQKFNYSHPTKTGGINVRLSLGRIWFNLLLPSDFPLINEPCDKNVVNNTIKEIERQFDAENAAEYTTKIMQEAFKMSSYIPTTFSIDSLILSDDVKDMKEELQKEEVKSLPEFEEKFNKITKQLEKEVDESGERLDNIRVSNAKDLPWGKLMIAQGYVGDIEGNILGPIKSAIVDGSSPEDFYRGAAEARNGL